MNPRLGRLSSVPTDSRDGNSVPCAHPVVQCSGLGVRFAAGGQGDAPDVGENVDFPIARCISDSSGPLGGEHPCPFSNPEEPPRSGGEGRGARGELPVPVPVPVPKACGPEHSLQGGFACQAHLFLRPVAMATGWLEMGWGTPGKRIQAGKMFFFFFFLYPGRK